MVGAHRGWADGHRQKLRELDARIQEGMALRSRLGLDGADGLDFLDWYEEQFLTEVAGQLR